MRGKTKGRTKKFKEKNKQKEAILNQENEKPIKRRKGQSGQGKTGRMLLTVIVVVLIVILLASVKNIFVLQAEKKALTEQKESLLLEKESLENELKNANDKEYIEEQARIQLKLIKPGEILYILEKEKKDDKKEDEEDH